MRGLAVKAVVGQLITSSVPFFTRHRGDDLVVPGTMTRHLGFSPLLAARFRPYRLAPRLTLPWSTPFLLSLNCTLILRLEHDFFSLSMYCPLLVTCHLCAAPAALLMSLPGRVRVYVCVGVPMFGDVSPSQEFWVK